MVAVNTAARKSGSPPTHLLSSISFLSRVVARRIHQILRMRVRAAMDINTHLLQPSIRQQEKWPSCFIHADNRGLIILCGMLTTQLSLESVLLVVRRSYACSSIGRVSSTSARFLLHFSFTLQIATNRPPAPATPLHRYHWPPRAATSHRATQRSGWGADGRSRRRSRWRGQRATPRVAPPAMPNR